MAVKRELDDLDKTLDLLDLSIALSIIARAKLSRLCQERGKGKNTTKETQEEGAIKLQKI